MMSDSSYVSIRVSTLRGDLEIPFDSYVKVGSKHILYCRKGEHFAGERLARLKSKKLQLMYIKEDHKDLYNDYISQSFKNAYFKESGKPIKIRAEIVQGVQQASAEDLMTEPDNSTFYRLAYQGAEKFIDFLTEEPLAFKSILDIPNEESTISHHCISVSAISFSIAHALGLSKTRAMEMPTLVVGSMIHDIEQYRLGLSFNKLPEEMSDTERKHFKEHTINGYNLIKDYDFYAPLIKDIVLKHEEHMDGTGSPNGLKEDEIDPLVFCVSVANAYDRYTQIKKLTHKEALKKMLIEKMGVYPLHILQALQSALKNHKIIA